MAEADDGLKDYVRDHSPEAFRRVVDRYVDIVYAAARRQVRDPGLAEDVTQAVFMVLAEKAEGIRTDRPLSAWLLQVTRYAAANAKRSRARQAHHERKAAKMAAATRTTSDPSNEAGREEWSPLLDEGISRLRGRDRDAIVLRFFEQKSTREVAQSLGVSEEAAAKRVERAVRKLREFFGRRGVTVSAGVLAATLAARSAEAAPAGLGASVTGSVAGVGAGSNMAVSSIVKGAIVAMKNAKAKAVLVPTLAGLLVAGASIGVVVKFVGSSDALYALPVKGSVTPASPWPVNFSDGSTADLVGITDNPKSGKWWAADGSPIPAPQQLPDTFNGVWTPDSSRAFYMAVRHESPTFSNTSFLVGIRQIHPADGNNSKGFGPHVTVTGYTVAVPNENAVVDMVLYLARGPWTIEDRYDLRSAPVAGATASANPLFRVSAVGEENSNVTITLASTAAPNPGMGEDQLVVVSSADGREYSNNFFTRNTAAVYRFPVRKDQAVTLIHRWRPFETREIRNISLRPGTKTAVSVQDGEGKE